MQEKIVYISNFKSDISDELKNKALNFLHDNNGEKLHYILPNGDLLKRYRYEIIEKFGYISDLNISTFDDLVNDILRYDFSKNISQPMKNIILKEVINDLYLSGHISYYSNVYDMAGFIKAVGDIIGEIKRSLVYPDDYKKRMPDELKYKELYLIYLKYEEFLYENNLLDREGKYIKAIEILNNNEEILKELEIVIIDFFYDFRPIEYEIIKKMSNLNCNIYINVPFYTNIENSIVKKNLERLKELGFTIKKKLKKDLEGFELLSTNFFSTPKNYRLDNKIDIVKAEDVDLEINNIFLEIKKIFKNKVELKDIGIIALNKEYADAIIKKAEYENIPINKGKKELLYYQPMILELVNILSCKNSNYSKEDLLRRINSKYFKILSEKETDDIELLLTSINFISFSDLKSNVDIENIDFELLDKLSSFIEDEDSLITESGTLSEYNNIISMFIEKYKVYENSIENYKNINDDKLFLRDIVTLNYLKEVLDEMEQNYLIKDTITLEEYLFILEEHLLDYEITFNQSKIDGIQILNPVTSRGRNFKYLFIPGLAQGNYPEIKQNSFFINQDNHSKLTKIGMDIKDYYEDLDNATMNLISGISGTKCKLYLSYCVGKDANKIESVYINEVVRQIGKENIVFKDIVLIDRFSLKQEDIKNRDELLIYTIKSLKDNKGLSESLIDYNKAYNPSMLYRIRQNNLGEYYRGNYIFNKYQGVLESDKSIAEVKKMIKPNLSITYIEKYAKCPFKFFLEEILKIEEIERDILEYDYARIGEIYHSVLNKYYEQNKNKIKNNIIQGDEFPLKEIASQVDNLLHKEFKRDNPIDLSLNKNRIIFERMKENLINYLSSDLENIFKYKYIPYQLEKSFRFQLDAEERINIIGRIDRVDKSIYTNKISIMDYKTSQSGISSISDINKGISFQLPVYMMSMANKNITQAGYGIIKNAENKYIIAIDGESEFVNRYNRLTKEEYVQLLNSVKGNIISIKDSIEKGYFPVKPKDCSIYCIYKDICRLVEVRGEQDEE